MVSSRGSSRTNTREQCAPYVTIVACGKPESGVFLTEKMEPEKNSGGFGRTPLTESLWRMQRVLCETGGAAGKCNEREIRLLRSLVTVRGRFWK